MVLEAIPKIKPWFDQTGLGRDDIAVKLARFFAGVGDDPLALAYSSAYDKGFLVVPVRQYAVLVANTHLWSRGTIDGVASAAQEWLDGLTDDSRKDFYRGYRRAIIKLRPEHGFRMMTDLWPDVARIIPALV